MIYDVESAHLIANIPGIPLTVLGDSPVATADHLPPPTLPPDSCKRTGGLDNGYYFVYSYLQEIET